MCMHFYLFFKNDEDDDFGDFGGFEVCIHCSLRIEEFLIYTD